MKQILAFILFSTIICWMMFSPIYKHVVLVRQALLQQEVDYLLEVGASGRYGSISATMIGESKQRLEKFGLNDELLRYEVTSTLNGSSQIGEIIPRGEGIILSLSYPYERMFMIDALVGITPLSEHERMRAYGIKMSEYIVENIDY